MSNWQVWKAYFNLLPPGEDPYGKLTSSQCFVIGISYKCKNFKGKADYCLKDRANDVKKDPWLLQVYYFNYQFSEGNQIWIPFCNRTKLLLPENSRSFYYWKWCPNSILGTFLDKRWKVEFGFPKSIVQIIHQYYCQAPEIQEEKHWKPASLLLISK